jgi:hypothetical protein
MDAPGRRHPPPVSQRRLVVVFRLLSVSAKREGAEAMVQRPTDVLAVRAGLAIRLQALPAERAEARAARVEHLRQLLEARSRLSLKRALMEGREGLL